MFTLHVEFTNKSIVTIKSDNLVELQALLHGIEIANREVNILVRVWIDGEKKY
jgi:hypothetical protein